MSWRIFEKWFNAAPWKDAEYITDNRGEKFWIHWRDKFERAAELHVWYRGHWVGVINLLREEDSSGTLADIIVFERYKLRGLGHAMMQELVRWAKENEFKEIWGFISPHDGSTTEELREWYKRQGFEVYEANPGNYQIFLELGNNGK